MGGFGVQAEDDFGHGAGYTGDDAVQYAYTNGGGEGTIVTDDAAGFRSLLGEMAEDVERAAGVFDPDDVGDLLDEREDGFFFEAGGELREVVEEDGERGRGGDFTAEEVEVFLLVGKEAGHRKKQALDFVALRNGGEFDGECDARGSYAAKDLGAIIAGLLDGAEDYVEVGGSGEAKLTGGSVDGEGGDAFSEEEVDESGERGHVDGVIGEAGREDSSVDTGDQL